MTTEEMDRDRLREIAALMRQQESASELNTSAQGVDETVENTWEGVDETVYALPEPMAPPESNDTVYAVADSIVPMVAEMVLTYFVTVDAWGRQGECVKITTPDGVEIVTLESVYPGEADAVAILAALYFNSEQVD